MRSSVKLTFQALVLFRDKVLWRSVIFSLSWQGPGAWKDSFTKFTEVDDLSLLTTDGWSTEHLSSQLTQCSSFFRVWIASKPTLIYLLIHWFLLHPSNPHFIHSPIRAFIQLFINSFIYLSAHYSFLCVRVRSSAFSFIYLLTHDFFFSFLFCHWFI